MTGLVIAGRFEGRDGTPVSGAAVHAVFLGDPPTNCGTAFDLERAPAHTDSSGEFRVTFSDPDRMLEQFGPPGIWRRGCFLLVGVSDGRTIGYAVASGEELAREPVRLRSLATVAVSGRVVDDDGRAVEGAAVESDHYYLPVGRGPHPHALVNFWLSRSPAEGEGRRIRLTELSAVTGQDGSFSLVDVPTMPGGLVLRVTGAGRAGLRIHYDPLQPLPPLVMTAGAEVRVRVLLPDGSPARGLYLDLGGSADDAPSRCGLTGIPVGVVGWEHRTAETDGEGRCRFGGLPPGDYSIRYVGLVEKLEASRRQGHPLWVSSIRDVDGPGDRLALPVIEVGPLARGERREIEVGAVEGSVVCGTVRRAEDNAAIENAVVRFEGASYPTTRSAGVSASLQSAPTPKGDSPRGRPSSPGRSSSGSRRSRAGSGSGSDARWLWDGSPARSWTSPFPSSRVTRLNYERRGHMKFSVRAMMITVAISAMLLAALISAARLSYLARAYRAQARYLAESRRHDLRMAAAYDRQSAEARARGDRPQADYLAGKAAEARGYASQFDRWSRTYRWPVSSNGPGNWNKPLMRPISVV